MLSEVQVLTLQLWSIFFAVMKDNIRGIIERKTRIVISIIDGARKNIKIIKTIVDKAANIIE